MALYLGNNKVSMKSGYTATTSFKDFLEHQGKFENTNYTDLAGILKFSDTENVDNFTEMFYNCGILTTIPLLDTSQVLFMTNTFTYCYELISIPKLDVSKVVGMDGAFRACSKLEQIHMTGMKASFDIHYSTKFTREALVEILNNLATVTSTKTLTMGSTNLAKLTDEDKSIATNKGWTLA